MLIKAPSFFLTNRDFKLLKIDSGEKINVKKIIPTKVAVIPITKPNIFF